MSNLPTLQIKKWRENSARPRQGLAVLTGVGIRNTADNLQNSFLFKDSKERERE